MTSNPKVVTYAYLKLFPTPARRRLLNLRNVRYKGAPEWYYLIGQLGWHLCNILESIAASYLFTRLRRSTKRKSVVVINDVLKRIPREQVVSYERVIRKAELFQHPTDSSIPLYVITVIEKHREIAAALSDPAAAEQLLTPILEQAATSSKSDREAFASKYGKA